MIKKTHLAAGAAAAVAAVALVHLAEPAGLAVDSRVLAEAVLGGAAFLATDLVLHRRPVRQVLPLYVTLVCAAALLAVAFRHNPALSVVAAVPLLVTRYSFERFTSARRAYAQTTEALSLLPEVAGLTPLGHGARTAVYAAALGAELGLDDAALTRLTTAARLHHIGYISLHEPEERDAAPDPEELGRLSGDLLRETGFLSDVADLVEQAQSGDVRQLEAAVVRVCSTLDDLAGGDAATATVDDPFAEVLRHHGKGFERTAAIALLRLHERRPAIIDAARDASRPLDLVAAGAAAPGHHHGPDAAEADESHDCR
jgi:hypothetical protein